MAGYQGTATRGDIVEALRALSEVDRRDMHTAARGKIVSYDAATQTATVKPLMSVNIGGEKLEAPDLLQVPVRQPRGGGFATHAPIKAGDEVDLTFYSRPIDKAHTDGEDSDHAPGRMHDISDAVATPAGSGAKNKMSGLPDGKMHIGTDDGQNGLQVATDGRLDLVKGGDSLLKIIRDFLTAYRDHNNTGLPLDEKAQAEALIARIDQMKA